MRLTELYEGKDDGKKGTYAGVSFSQKTIKDIKEYIKDNKIPNHTKFDKLHTTLLYSRKYCPKYEPAGKLDEPWEGHADKFDVWDSQPDDEGHVARCLVLCYHCPKLAKRHAALMDEHNATYDFDEYKPHVTFSYDIGDMDIKDLPKFEGKIEVVEEYGEDLNLDWAKDNSDISEKDDK